MNLLIISVVYVFLVYIGFKLSFIPFFLFILITIYKTKIEKIIFVIVGLIIPIISVLVTFQDDIIMYPDNYNSIFITLSSKG
jgi:hypothetical protein